MSNEYTDILYPSGRVSHVELKITNSSGVFIVVLINKGDEKKARKYLWNYSRFNRTNFYSIKTTTNRKSIHLGRHLMGVKNKNLFVDCKDKDRLNMRRGNLRVVSRSKNSLNRKIPVHNTSGRLGVSEWKSPYGVSIWSAIGTVNKKKFAKSFSSSKYGYEEARRMAVKFREDFEKEHGVISERGA